ncbi:unnamed protein product, partial [Ectocarpus sp. 6 AP-2014]
MDASLHGRVTTVKVLLAAGADAGMRGLWDAAPALSLAAQFGEIGMMKALLEHGVDANYGGVGRSSALHWAQFNSAGCVAVLLDAGADINDMSEKSEGQTPFHFVAKAGSNEALLAPLRRGASVDQKTDDGLTALHLAGRMEGDDMDHTVDILFEVGCLRTSRRSGWENVQSALQLEGQRKFPE